MEVLDQANEVANNEITSQRIRAIERVLTAEAGKNGSRIVHLAEVANDWTDMQLNGSFDSTHFTFDKCGNLVHPKIQER